MDAKGDYAYIYDMAVWKNRKNIQLGVSFEEFSSGKEIPNSGKNSENGIPIPENPSEIQNGIPEEIPKKVEWVF